MQVGTIADDALTAAMVKGVRLCNGGYLRAKQARMLRQGKTNSWIGIILDEGRNRHIRRMFAALGIEVLRLVRVAIGPLKLGDLPKGAFRHLTQAEKAAFDTELRTTHPSPK